MHKIFLFPILASLFLVNIVVAPAHASSTLERVKKANALSCGIDIEEPEYSTDDAHGNHVAFDTDICKAVAVAVLGTNAKITVHSYRYEKDAYKALRAGEIDLLATGSPNYMSTNAKSDIGFARPIFYDFQAFLVDRSKGYQSLKDLTGKKVCFLGGTEIEFQLQSFMKKENIAWLPFLFQEEGEMEAALITGNCAAVTADVTQLAYERIAFKAMARNYEILPSLIAKDPLAPAYRMDDPQWAAIVNWTMEALIQAEESGITHDNIDAMKKSGNIDAERLLGVQHGYGQFLLLDDDWAARVIATVGNYGEIYARDLGPTSEMRLPRGPNSLWTQGGLLYALPLR